jgi:phytoene desaturase
MNEKSYDAIIIGAGAGGLSAGISLASQGWKVLIAEKNGQPGGNCTSKKYSGYTFDLAVHQLSGIAGKGICAAILEEYGVDKMIDFRPVSPFLVVDMADQSYKIHSEKDAFRAELIKNFPDDAKDIDMLISKLDSLKKDALIGQRLLYGSSSAMKKLIAEEINLKKILTFPFTSLFGIIFKMNLSADEILRRWVKNPKLRAVIYSSWIYLGLPPKKLSGLMMNIFLSMQYSVGTYYPRGGSQRVADAMTDVFRKRGGKVLLNAPVKSIITKGKRAFGVELSDGKKFYADTIISNADIRHTYRDMLEPGMIPSKFMKRLKDMPISMGPFKVYLGLDYNVAEHGLKHHEYMIFPDYNHEAIYQSMLRGEIAGMSVYSPTAIAPELAPKGHSTLILTTMMPWKSETDWRCRKDEIVASMIALVEKKRLPGLSKHIKLKKVLTPEDLQKLTNSSEGSMYGWENTPNQSLIRRLSMKSPLQGLYHVGHWTRPGTGVTAAIISGWLLGKRLNSRVGKFIDRII